MEIKNSINEIKGIPKSLKNRLDQAEERLQERKDRSFEISEGGAGRKERKKEEKEKRMKIYCETFLENVE